MLRTVLDIYDDPSGQVLRQKIARFGDVPHIIKTAEFLSPDRRERLPDHVHALITLDNGQKLRKYACIDAGNTALNVIYFLERKDTLPQEAQKTAARNLLQACSWYKIKPPYQLYKVAELADQKNKKVKTSELSGTATMPQTLPMQSKREAMKTASRKLEPYVDITGMAPPVQVRPQPPAKHYCLEKCGEKKYPIDTLQQVKLASQYFDNHFRSFEPLDRHLYCLKLASRARSLGVPVSPFVERYGSTKYAEDIQYYLNERLAHFLEDSPQKALLQDMLEKQAGLRPEAFATVLERFDRDTGLSRLWDKGVTDPYFSVFGAEKRAGWSFSEGADTINEDQLRAAVKTFPRELSDSLGEETFQGLKDSPIDIFESLPRDVRRIIIRFGQQVTA